MSVTYLIVFDVRPGQTGRFLELLDGVLDAMRHEANFRDAALHRDPAAPQRFMLIETWADHADVLEVQLSRSYRTEWHAALDEVLVQPRDITMWDKLREDRAGGESSEPGP